MHHSPHALFDSAWPRSVAIAWALLLTLRLLFRRSPWAIVVWLSLAVATAACTFGLAIILILLVFSGSGGPGLFSPLSFAGPLFVALVLGLPACFIVWALRPAFATLQRRHWGVALSFIPVALLLFLNSPHIYDTQLVIQCVQSDGKQPSDLTLQRMQVNEVVPVGTPLAADASGRFQITLNRRESFTAILSAPGLQPRKVGLFPHPDKGFWLFFGDGEPRRLPLKAPGTITLTMTEAPNNALQRTEAGGRAGSVVTSSRASLCR